MSKQAKGAGEKPATPAAATDEPASPGEQ